MNGTNMIADVYVNMTVLDNMFFLAKSEEFNSSICDLVDVNILLTTGDFSFRVQPFSNSWKINSEGSQPEYQHDVSGQHGGCEESNTPNETASHVARSGSQRS